MSVASTPTSGDVALASALRDTVARLGRRLRAQRIDTDLSLGQLAALATLDRHGPLRPGELATHEKVSAPSMTRIVAALEERGYVERTPDPADGRQVLVSISRAGRTLLAADRRRRDAWVAMRLRELDRDEVAALREALPVLEKLSRA